MWFYTMVALIGHRRMRLLILFTLSVLIIAIATYYYKDVKPFASDTLKREHEPPTYGQPDESKNVISSMKLGRNSVESHVFLYYVQTASCLSDRYLHSDMLGDVMQCRCNVLVLSYKSHCLTNAFQHIRYFDSFNSTWTIGRNELYRKAKQVIGHYRSFLYHTFLDGDLTFSWLPPRFLDKSVLCNRSTSPMRGFENFLIERNPVVGGTIYSSRRAPTEGLVKRLITHATGDEASWKRGHRLPETSLILFMDAAAASFHRNAIDNLLPYDESFEKRSLWISQQSMIVRMYVKYRGQSIAYFPVAVCNGGTHSYPQDLIPYKEFFKYERFVAPPDLQNHRIWNVTDPQLLGTIDPVFRYAKPHFTEYWNPKMVPYQWLYNSTNKSTAGR